MKSKECSIIYGGKREDRSTFADEFIRSNPQYLVQIREEINHPKKGFLGKNLSAIEILMKHKIAKNLGEHYVKAQMRELELYNFLDRSPLILSEKQKLLLSMFLDVLDGRKSFFLWDENVLTTKDIIKFIFWCRTCDKKSGIKRNMIWLTGEMKEAFLEPVWIQSNGQQYEELSSSLAVPSIYYVGNAYYELVDSSPMEKKGDDIVEEICKGIQKKKMDELETALKLIEIGAYKAAESVYQQLIFRNDPMGMTQLAQLYIEHFDNKDMEIEKLLKTACTQHQYPDAFATYEKYKMRKGMKKKDI